MTKLKWVDFIGAVAGILTISFGLLSTDAPDGSPEWWTAFLSSYLISILPFAVSCGMIARRSGRSLFNALWGVLAAFGVFMLTAQALGIGSSGRRER